MNECITNTWKRKYTNSMSSTSVLRRAANLDGRPALLCKAKMQYLLTLEVSRYCLLALRGSAAVIMNSVEYNECIQEQLQIKLCHYHVWQFSVAETWRPRWRKGCCNMNSANYNELKSSSDMKLCQHHV